MDSAVRLYRPPRPSCMRKLLLALSLSCALMAADSSTAGFDKTVQPLISKSCAPCHNDRLASGGLNLNAFSTANSVLEQREGWDVILQKIRTGEMPPKGMPRPPAAQIDAFNRFFQDQF